jgi:hypothetical protein
MVHGGEHMETKERVIDLPWRDAVAAINAAVNDQMTTIENDASLEPGVRLRKVKALEKAWQRLLVG